jgi:hypothetical protein
MDTDNTHATPITTTRTAGSLTVTVWPDTPLGEHHRYAYRITEVTTGQTVQGRDLFTGAGQPVDPDRAVQELAGFLSAAGESRQDALDNPGDIPEHEGLFPDWLAEAARRNADALTLLTEDPPTEPDSSAPSGLRRARRWISVVFLQGSEADEALELIDRDGTDATIKHLAGYDYGQETVDAAMENGYVYDTLPIGTTDRVATSDVYTLTYNHSFGYVGLVREYDALPDPVLLGIDAPTPAQPSQPTPPAAARRTPPEAGGDWFGPPPGTCSSSPGRGPSL